MSSVWHFDERFRRCLEQLPVGEAQVRVFPADLGKWKYFGDIVSPGFEGLNEGRRQAIVWERLLSDLDDDDQARVEFVYTDTPAERAEKSGGRVVPANRGS